MCSQEPSDFESLLASAQQAQARRDFRAATNYYRSAVNLHPEIAELRANLGLMYYQIGNHELASQAFEQAIRLDPNLLVPNLFLGLDYVKLKRFSEAIPWLKKAALIKPTDTEALMALGQAYTATGKTRLAITSYLRTVEIDAGRADGWFHLGVAYLEQVEADARVLLARHKNSGYLHALVADTFTEQGAFIQAAEAYKTTLASPSFPSGTHAAYGFVLIYQHDLPGAERELNAELASNPRSLMANLGLARLQIEKGEAKGGVSEIVGIWKADSSFLQANATMLRRGLAPSKMSELRHMLEEGRTVGEVPEKLASLFQANPSVGNITDFSQPSGSAVDQGRSAKESDRVAAKYEECADLVPVLVVQQLQAKHLGRLASCAYSTAKYQTSYHMAQRLALRPATEAEGLYWETRAAQKLATEALNHASAMDSNSPTLHVLLGDVYRQRKYYPDAEQEYRKALAVQPEDTGALFGLALALLADDQVEEAFHVTQAALTNRRDDPELNAVMGQILCGRNDFAAAEPYLKKGLNTKPEYVPHVHALLGKVYARTGRTEQAIAELKFALSGDSDGTVHYQIARLYLKLGDRDSARQALDISKRLRSEGLNRATVAMQQGEYSGESE